jgi:hypothetical protein
MRGPNRLDRKLVHLAKTPNTCMRACGCSSDVTTFRRRSHFLPLLRAQRATRTLLRSHTHTHTHTHTCTHRTHTHTHTTLMHCDNPRVDQTCAQELGVEPDKVLISNKLAWKRVPLTTPEPTFEPGVWVNLKNDAVQDISCVLVHPFSLQIIRTRASFLSPNHPHCEASAPSYSWHSLSALVVSVPSLATLCHL